MGCQRASVGLSGRRHRRWRATCHVTGQTLRLVRTIQARRTATRLWIALLLALPALAACRARPSQSQETPGVDQSVTLETLFTEAYSGMENARRVVVRDAAGWRALWGEIVGARTPRPEAPAVDFGSEMVIVAAMGQRGSGGHSIAIDEVRADDGGLAVVVRETAPGRGCFVTQALTAPVTAVRVPAHDGPVRFIEQKETQDCE